MMVGGDCVPVFGNYTSIQRDLDSDCCPGGMITPGIPRSGGLMILWLVILLWIFLGVALGADVFMTSIEVLTSKEKSIKKKDKGTGEERTFHVRVWNSTVANLTLMAFGSSAPEILLSVIETMNEGFNSGALGPSTIVGSAAFNLMVITAVCVVCLPAGETRTIKQFGVFCTTAAYSIFAYVWLLLIVLVFSPEVITVAEGVLTVLFFVILVIQAYITDKYSTAVSKRVNVKAISKGDASAAIKAAGLSKDATPQEIADALKDEMMPFKSRAYYKHQAMKGVGHAAGGKHSAKVGAEELQTVTVDGKGKDPPFKEAGAVEFVEDSVGILRWKSHKVDVMESGGSVTLKVERVGGSKGKVSCEFATKNQKAVAGKDFEEKKGSFEWEDGDTSTKEVTIAIYDDDEFEKDEEFTVVLSEATGGAKFDDTTDGSDESDVCTVVIVNDDDRATKLMSAMSMLRLDADSLDIAGDDWVAQIKDCFAPEDSSPKGKIMHVLTFPWKFMFAVLPPPGLCGGWPCFFAALVGIGFQVILINDFASQMGCEMFIKPSVTAITFVALGTSLPDTFASMQAARGDKYADNSIGNVTGSNSVNVFFGLGVPWLMGAVYWAASGVTPDWLARFDPITGDSPLPQDIFDAYKTTGAFVVPSGDLGLSVIVFTVCAIITIGLIFLRRAMGAYELGGPAGPKWATFTLLIILWIVYIVVSTMSTYGLIG